MHLIIPNEPNQMMISNTTANFHFLRVALGGQTQILQRETSHWLAQAPGVHPVFLLPWPSSGRALTSSILPVSPPLPGSHSCSSRIFSCPFTSPLGSTWNTLFLWSAGGVLCPSQDSAMMFSEKIPEFSRKTSHPWSGSQGVGHREWAGGCEGVFWA